MSAQTVSKLTRDLDEAVRQFHQARLSDDYVYLFLDGVSLRVRRPAGRKRVQMLVAYGIRRDGSRHLLAFLRSQGESQADWEGLLEDLYRRGLEGRSLGLILSDGCAGLAAAIRTVYPRVRHQRCWVHKMPKPTAAQLVLKRLVLPTDTALAIELWSADGKLIDHVGDTPETAAAATDTRQSFSIPGNRAPQTAMPRGDSARFLPFFEGRDHQVYYWMTVPVMDRGVHVGWIAEQARIKPRPGADKQINSLLGDHTAAYFRNTTDSFWTTLGGTPVATAFDCNRCVATGDCEWWRSDIVYASAAWGGSFHYAANR